MRLTTFRLALWITAFTCSWTAPSRSQTRPDATALAAQVQSFYDKTSSIQASFQQSYYYKLYQRSDSSRGKVVFKKPGKMRWDYAQPNGKVMVSDGRMLQVFEPGGKGADGSVEAPQMFEQAIDKHQLPAAFAFLMGTGRLAQDFHFRLIEAQGEHFRDGYVLELTPKTPQPQFEKIVFFVGAGKTQGVVHRIVVLDAAGNRNRFDFKNLKFNASVDPQRFQFRAPAGTRRITP